MICLILKLLNHKESFNDDPRYHRPVILKEFYQEANSIKEGVLILLLLVLHFHQESLSHKSFEYLPSLFDSVLCFQQLTHVKILPNILVFQVFNQLQNLHPLVPLYLQNLCSNVFMRSFNLITLNTALLLVLCLTKQAQTLKVKVN